MSLQPGHKLAHYEILEPIGKGGMGEVYRARDGKLGRDVAIKVLPEEFAQDAERRARFKREAKVLASLNHPNIASIYGVEQSDTTHYLVLELVPGETLAERISRGPIPVEEAIEIATKIAEALEEAHEHGIVHRDLKPANIKQTEDGKIKVLDFGLAKAFVDDATETDSSMSPTLTRDATRVGVILGTAAYMSPEQAKGKRVDKRTDIWAFGAVFYEMLTGRRVFEGEDVSETLAAVLKETPEWARLPSRLPETVSRLLKRCLTRELARRLRDIGEARIAIEDGGVETAPEVQAAPTRRRYLPWGVAALLALALVLELATDREPEVGSPERFHVAFPEESPEHMALSRDGRRLAYVAGSPRSLYTRALDRLEATKLAGTEGARYPFFSPDGEWVGFFTESTLEKVSVTGGAPMTLASVTVRSRGGTWGDDDTIVFTPIAVASLLRIGASGGEAEEITHLAESERSHRWPQFLPGGDAVLFSIQEKGKDFNAGRIEVVTLSDGKRKVVHEGGYYGRYSPSGHLLYVYQGTLFAVAFDLETLETTGSGVPVVQDITYDLTFGFGPFALGGNGTLVYQTVGVERTSSLVWVDHQGSASPIEAEVADYLTPRIGPDGGRLALEVDRDIWLHDLDRAVRTRFTLDDGLDRYPVWSPDGSYIVFGSEREGSTNLYRKRADGAGEVERLLEPSPSLRFPSSFSPDGTKLAFTEIGEATGADLMVLHLDEDRTPEVFLQTLSQERRGVFSPDGLWMAYQSDETGEIEAFVRPYPGPGGAVQVSSDGGTSPAWSPKGSELYYRSAGRMMMVPYRVDDGTFRPGRPQELFAGDFVESRSRRSYDVSPDGERFLMLAPIEDPASATRIVLIRNWFDELRRLAPPR